ncbi:MAG: amidase [Bacillota bacterium]|nr:amidase [Bacillota bacterium]
MLTKSEPLAAVAARLRDGETGLRSYVAAACDRVEAVDGQIQALVPEPRRRERLLQEAAALEARYPLPAGRPPLYGVLVGVKDIFRADGFPTRAGSHLPPELFDGPEACCVASLRHAGALVLGKTVTAEFACAEPGPTRNPHNLAHTPGGSSSGSAAAVSAGFCPLALGTQTVGSVIRPAAFCGVVGFKPSYRRVSTGGLILYSASADHVGFFTQDVAGARMAAAALVAGWHGPRGDDVAEIRRPVLGIPDGPYMRQASAEALEALKVQLDRLGSAGFEVRRVEALRDIADINRRHRRMTSAELAAEHSEWFARFEDLYRPRTAAAILDGQAVAPGELEAARAGRGELRRELEGLMDGAGVDLWVCPSATGPAPEGIGSTGDPIMNLPWTHAGLPVLSLPAGLSAGRLPLGLQVIARYGDDEALLHWADGISGALE